MIRKWSYDVRITGGLLTLSMVCAQYELWPGEWLSQAMFFFCNLGCGPAIMYVVRLRFKSLKSLQALPVSRITEARKGHRKGKTMTEKGSYDRAKFVEQAVTAEEERLLKEKEWNKKNEVVDQRERSHSFSSPTTDFRRKKVRFLTGRACIAYLFRRIFALPSRNACPKVLPAVCVRTYSVSAEPDGDHSPQRAQRPLRKPRLQTS